MSRHLTTVRSWATAALVVLVTAGCAEGQPVDAGGERGGGGLAFVVFVVFFFIFIATLFYMDRVRSSRAKTDDE